MVETEWTKTSLDQELDNYKLSNVQISSVSGHGAVVFPPPRNNIDHEETPWSGPVPDSVPAVSDPRNGVWCPIPAPLFNSSLTGF